MKKIAIIATGGTIAGSGSNGAAAIYQAGKIKVAEVLKSIPNVEHLAKIENFQLLNIDSNEINLESWVYLANFINKIILDYDGVVITHGTDTLEETAYFLSLTINTRKPVVITGAMRPATATSADGPYNLYQALALAASDDAYDKGLMALFSNTIYNARDVHKVSNYKIDAFEHKTSSVLGYMQDERVYFHSVSNKVSMADSRFAHEKLVSLPNVAIVPYYVGAEVDILFEAAKNNQGIVIIGTGSGNYSKSWYQAIKTLAKQGIIFVRSSRVPRAIIFDDNIFDPDNICLVANTLSPQKARILLMLALTQTTDRKQLENFFLQY